MLHLACAAPGPLAGLGIARRSVARRAGLALFGFLGFDRAGGGAQLALQVRGAGLDCVQLGPRLVCQVVGNRKFGHPTAFFRLAFTELAELLLSGSHGSSLQ